MSHLWISLLCVLPAIALLCVGALIDLRDRQAERIRQFQQRLRIQHEQFRAEQRIQQLSQGAMQAMLDATRQQRGHDQF
ncbi:MAG: hypothetical protein QOE23_1291 [Pseudonocardiales bacterium]|nr:hypothetical protein [Pseudonocardiales bacterium]